VTETTGEAYREGGVRRGDEEGEAFVFRGQGQCARRQPGVNPAAALLAATAKVPIFYFLSPVQFYLFGKPQLAERHQANRRQPTFNELLLCFDSGV